TYSIPNIDEWTVFCLRGDAVVGYSGPDRSYECQRSGTTEPQPLCPNLPDMPTDDQYNFKYTKLISSPPQSTTPTNALSPTPFQKPGDIGGNADGTPDGKVNIQDYVLLFESYGKNPGESNYHARADINTDGKVNILDYTILFENFGM